MNQIQKHKSDYNFTFITKECEPWFEACALDAYNYFISETTQVIYASHTTEYTKISDAEVVGVMPPTLIPFTMTLATAEAFRECECIVEYIYLKDHIPNLSDIDLTAHPEFEPHVDEITMAAQEDISDCFPDFIDDVLQVWKRHGLFYILSEDEVHVLSEIGEEYAYEFVNSPLIGVW